MTPLHIASREGHTEIVKILLAHGANVNDIAKSKEMEVIPPCSLCYQTCFDPCMSLHIQPY